LAIDNITKWDTLYTQKVSSLESEKGKEISLTYYSLSSLLKEMNLATVSEFTPREKLLYDRI
jgi:hypothetical protein